METKVARLAEQRGTGFDVWYRTNERPVMVPHGPPATREAALRGILESAEASGDAEGAAGTRSDAAMIATVNMPRGPRRDHILMRVGRDGAVINHLDGAIVIEPDSHIAMAPRILSVPSDGTAPDFGYTPYVPGEDPPPCLST